MRTQEDRNNAAQAIRKIADEIQSGYLTGVIAITVREVESTGDAVQLSANSFGAASTDVSAATSIEYMRDLVVLNNLLEERARESVWLKVLKWLGFRRGSVV